MDVSLFVNHFPSWIFIFNIIVYILLYFENNSRLKSGSLYIYKKKAKINFKKNDLL